MCVFSKSFCIFVLSLASIGYAFADAPYITNNTAGSSERVQVGDMSCDTSKPQATINVGAYGNNGNRYSYEDNDKGGFVSVSIPIGSSSVTTDCSRLYDIGLKMKETELKQREMMIQQQEENLRLQQSRSMSFK